MNTGICKALTFGATLALTGCSGTDAFGFLQDGIAPGPAGNAQPFTLAEMVQGAVTLVPPPGFCVDPRSLSQTFAIMARCDVLGGRNGALDAPLGVITISLEKSGETGALSAKALGESVDGGRVLQQETAGSVTYLRIESKAPSGGLSDVHWRAVDQINGYDVALALYAPDGSSALSNQGPRILRRLLEGSEEASVAKDVATRTLRPRAKPKKLF